MSRLLTDEQAEVQDHTYTGPIRIANADMKKMSSEELDAELDAAFKEIREYFHLWHELDHS